MSTIEILVHKGPSGEMLDSLLTGGTGGESRVRCVSSYVIMVFTTTDVAHLPRCEATSPEGLASCQVLLTGIVRFWRRGEYLLRGRIGEWGFTCHYDASTRSGLMGASDVDVVGEVPGWVDVIIEHLLGPV